MVCDNLLVSEDSGKRTFRELSPKKMSELFQDFVASFYAKESNYKVSSKKVNWDAVPVRQGDERFLPEMVTDIVLESEDKCIVIDTKFYEETLKEHYRTPDKGKIERKDLFQIFSYLKNLETRGGSFSTCTGLLLYPTTKEHLDLRYDIQGHRVEIKTIDLNQPWENIHQDLLRIACN
jgi:5-methylcytosine-specific restriction enzyme subunit McrC